MATTSDPLGDLFGAIVEHANAATLRAVKVSAKAVRDAKNSNSKDQEYLQSVLDTCIASARSQEIPQAEIDAVLNKVFAVLKKNTKKKKGSS